MTSIQSKIIDYNKFHFSKIYVLHSDDFHTIYIGSTIKTLEKRLKEHAQSYKYQLEKPNYNKLSSHLVFHKYGVENVKISLIDHFKCDTLQELHNKEYEYINTFDCVNIIKSNNDLHRLLTYGTTKKSTTSKPIPTNIHDPIIEQNYKPIFDKVIFNMKNFTILHSYDRVENPSIDAEKISNSFKIIEDMHMIQCHKVLEHVKPEYIINITFDIFKKVNNNIEYCRNYQKFINIPTDHRKKLTGSTSTDRDDFCVKACILQHIMELISKISNIDGKFYCSMLKNLSKYIHRNDKEYLPENSNLAIFSKKIFKLKIKDVNTSQQIAGFINQILKHFSLKIEKIGRTQVGNSDLGIFIVGYINQETKQYISYLKELDI